jgi:hypothetical protein
MELPQKVDDLESLIKNNVQENIHLDYKDSRAIDGKKRREMAKDVSAFANSDGGILPAPTCCQPLMRNVMHLRNAHGSDNIWWIARQMVRAIMSNQTYTTSLDRNRQQRGASA